MQVAPRWPEDGYTTIVLTGTSLALADVQAAFDEIHEKCHVEGIDLCVDEHHGHPRATLSKARP